MSEITDKEYFWGLLATIIFLIFYIKWQTKKYKNSDNPMDIGRKLESYIIMFFAIILFIFFSMKLIGS
ncbi:hypothetical protein [Elizabethkingia sp. JS20170427COW]|uniref:hypothetical protein n=1 Tax=Elizabethkingia sp. JS20170427COW TaxID=2583851 RepID=UPI0011100BBD|nr:hypothetical protein [Elizabethkingia sp. JS20170427COW]QCX54388.1 hypothetical protein FGE20_11870 [Elizabethkingia sp. JS20170427COW]